MILPPLDCNGCRKCCIGNNRATLRPDRGDVLKEYVHRPGPNGTRVLDKGKDGNCVYLGKTGCQIYNRRPYECRTFDCRTYFLRLEDNQMAFDARLGTEAGEAMMEGRTRVRRLRGKQAA